MRASEDANVKPLLQPRILLVEPDPGLLATRTLLLGKSRFLVITACNARDIYHLRCATQVNLAILSDTLSQSELRAAAESVRAQWSTAKILILGAVQVSFEDYLYDEALDPRFQPDKLLDSIYRLCCSAQPGGHRSHTYTPAPSKNHDQRRALLLATPPDNDPSKEDRGISSLNKPLNAPASAQPFTRHNPT
jgi:hypothetical protein